MEIFILSQFISSYIVVFFPLYCSVNTHCGSPKHIFVREMGTRVTYWSLCLCVYFLLLLCSAHTHEVEEKRDGKRKFSFTFDFALVAFHWFTIIDKFTAYYWKVTQNTSVYNTVQLRWSFLKHFKQTFLCKTHKLIVHSLHSKAYRDIDRANDE